MICESIISSMILAKAQAYACCIKHHQEGKMQGKNRILSMLMVWARCKVPVGSDHDRHNRG